MYVCVSMCVYIHMGCGLRGQGSPPKTEPTESTQPPNTHPQNQNQHPHQTSPLPAPSPSCCTA